MEIEAHFFEANIGIAVLAPKKGKAGRHTYNEVEKIIANATKELQSLLGEDWVSYTLKHTGTGKAMVEDLETKKAIKI